MQSILGRDCQNGSQPRWGYCQSARYFQQPKCQPGNGLQPNMPVNDIWYSICMIRGNPSSACHFGPPRCQNWQFAPRQTAKMAVSAPDKHVDVQPPPRGGRGPCTRLLIFEKLVELERSRRW
jgi:hypothetical protein